MLAFSDRRQSVTLMAKKSFDAVRNILSAISQLWMNLPQIQLPCKGKTPVENTGKHQKKR
jgi:predicted translin family RNA/ssDNA-binding protein